MENEISLVKIDGPLFLVIINAGEEDEHHYICWDPDTASGIVFEAWQNDMDAEVREISLEDLLDAGQVIPEKFIVKRIAKKKRFSRQVVPRRGGLLKKLFGR